MVGGGGIRRPRAQRGEGALVVDCGCRCVAVELCCDGGGKAASVSPVTL